MDDLEETENNSEINNSNQNDTDEDTIDEVSEILAENNDSNLVHDSHLNEDIHDQTNKNDEILESMGNPSDNSLTEMENTSNMNSSNLNNFVINDDHVSNVENMSEVNTSEVVNKSTDNLNTSESNDLNEQTNQIDETLSHESTLPSHQSTLPSHQSNLPSHESNLPSHESTLPSHESNLPSHESNLPSHKSTHSSYHSDIQDIDEELNNNLNEASTHQSIHSEIPTTSNHDSMVQTNLSQQSGSHLNIEETSDNHLDTESFDVNQEHEDINQNNSMNDDDVIAETIDTISEGHKDLADELNKLEKMSEAGKIDDENTEELNQSTPNATLNEAEQVFETISHHSQDQTHHEIETQTDFDSSPLTDEIKFERPIHPLEQNENIVSNTSDQNNENVLSQETSQENMFNQETSQENMFNQEISQENMFKSPQGSNSMENDVKTVITDDHNRPLTEGDKEEILDELEGKPISADVHINHKSIESLHHINVYHYLPPKFISANAMPMMYPGMVPPQQQQMTPGPIINIHNSTNSSGGNGGVPNGQMPNGNGNSVVVSNPTPSQNWGQVVYSNSNHGMGNVAQNTNESLNNVNQPMAMKSMNQSLLDSQPHIQIDQTPQLNEPVYSQNPMTNQVTTQTPEIINDQPIISNDEIKVDPIVNTEVINKSPINVETDENDISHLNMTDMNSEDHGLLDEISHKSVDHSIHNDLVEITDSDLDDKPLTDEIKLEEPDILDNVDEETVDIDPNTINDENGQSVVLGDETSEDNISSKSMIII